MQACVVAPVQCCMMFHWLKLLGSTATACSLASAVCVLGGMVHSGSKGCWAESLGPVLGITAGSSSAQIWWYARTWLWVPAAVSCVVGGTGCRHTLVVGEGQQLGQGHLWMHWQLQGPWL